MRKIILFIVISFSVSLEAQTFIGKSEDEIMKLVKANGYKLESKQSHPEFGFHSSMYADTLLDRHYIYEFDAHNKCEAYTIFTDNSVSREAVRKEIEKNAADKISDKSWVQKVDGKVYGWHQQGSDEHSIFVTTEIKQ